MDIMMKQIYCDNGSTSFPKAPGLGKVMGEHIDFHGVNISRGGYMEAYSVESRVIETREMLCEIFNFPNAKNVIFTSGATAGLNMVLKGLLKQGDHVLTTSIEHNAVVRPLTQLEEKGIIWEEVKCSNSGELDISAVEKMIRPETKLVVMLHASNVCGSLIPIDKVGKLCKEKDIFFAVDASQSAGGAIIDMDAWKIDALILPGHKGLMGPQGIGALLLTDRIANMMSPLIAGGTGSASNSELMPGFLPDKFQPGTLNIPGIIGLGHAVAFLNKEGLQTIIDKKKELTSTFMKELENMEGIRIVGPTRESERCSVVSLDFLHIDNAEASFMLENEFGIMTRCGLHCAPHAHQTLGTFPQGTVRFSFGYFNTLHEVSCVIDAIWKILKY